jgi:hypothetical protein
MLSLHQAHMQYPWICSRKPVMKSWTSFKILKPNPVLPGAATIHNNRVSAPPKPKWTWTLRLWIPDPIWMFVVLQGCHSGRFTLPYILWKSSTLTQWQPLSHISHTSPTLLKGKNLDPLECMNIICVSILDLAKLMGKEVSCISQIL